MTAAEARATLGLPSDAGVAQVKQAYRTLVRTHHPDLNPGDATAVERFHKVKQAYDLLTRQPHIAAGTPPYPGASVVPFDETRRPFSAPRVGTDVRGQLKLTLTEAFSGCHADVPFTDPIGCDSCGATGAAPGAVMITCRSCNDLDRDCVWCQGRGVVADPYCPACAGSGVVDVERSVRVAVPRSVSDGEELLMRGKGNWGLDRRGDLRMRIAVSDSPGMRRIGDDLEVDVDIGVLQAILGGFAYVPTIGGTQHKIKIDPGTPSGRRLRLRGQGMFRQETGDERGDLYAVVQIDVPTELTERERFLYLQLLEEERAQLIAGDR